MPNRPMRHLRPLAAACSALAAAAALSGCVKRTISISSEPPGAIVILNDVEVGRTPLLVDFTHYGNYDVRVVLPGYEPVFTRRSARTPVYDIPPADLLAEVAPIDIESTVRWHFDLEPRLEARMPREDLEAVLLQSGRELRGRFDMPRQ